MDDKKDTGSGDGDGKKTLKEEEDLELQIQQNAKVELVFGTSIPPILNRKHPNINTPRNMNNSERSNSDMIESALSAKKSSCSKELQKKLGPTPKLVYNVKPITKETSAEEPMQLSEIMSCLDALEKSKNEIEATLEESLKKASEHQQKMDKN